jgi:acyl-coenzyme A thioesterase PaaI-like protein
VDSNELEAQGWRLLPTIRYSAALGPVWVRGTVGGGVEVMLDAQPHIANDNFGIVHGGAMSTFADLALGCGVGYAVRGGKPLVDVEGSHFVTVQLQVQFTAAARIGTFLLARPEVVRKTTSLVFIRTLITAEDRTVASADGVFKLLDPDKAGAIRAG